MLGRDALALPPTLNSRVIAMAESPSQRTDTASIGDECCVIHTQDVHSRCTQVNVECVHPSRDKVYVQNSETTGVVLRRLLDRSGLSQRDAASRAGYKHASGIQRFIEATYTKRLPADVAEKFALAFEGKGSPPITREEVMALTGVVATNAAPVAFEGGSLEVLHENLPVWGTALGAFRMFDGESVEQTMLNSGEIMEYVKRPAILKGKAHAYGLFVQGSSMEPMVDDGDMIVAVKDSPLASGDLVVLYLRDDEDDGHRARGVLVKRLVRRSASWVELRQYEPDMTFRVPMDDVLRIDRVLTRREMLS